VVAAFVHQAVRPLDVLGAMVARARIVTRLPLASEEVGSLGPPLWQAAAGPSRMPPVFLAVAVVTFTPIAAPHGRVAHHFLAGAAETAERGADVVLFAETEPAAIRGTAADAASG
jgi:hypothetical protein